jgi:hypothetical protein
MDFTIKTENNFEDYIAFQNLMGKMLENKLYTFGALVIAILPAIFIIYLVTVIHDHRYAFYTLYFFTGYLSLTLLLGSSYRRKHRSRLLARLYPATSDRLITLRITDNGITFEDFFSTETSSWEGYQKLLEDSKNIYLLTIYGGVLIIRKQSIADKYNDLMTEIQQKIGRLPR